jgi:hypothetical protein
MLRDADGGEAAVTTEEAAFLHRNGCVRSVTPDGTHALTAGTTPEAVRALLAYYRAHEQPPPP